MIYKMEDVGKWIPFVKPSTIKMEDVLVVILVIDLMWIEAAVPYSSRIPIVRSMMPTINANNALINILLMWRVVNVHLWIPYAGPSILTMDSVRHAIKDLGCLMDSVWLMWLQIQTARELPVQSVLNAILDFTSTMGNAYQWVTTVKLMIHWVGSVPPAMRGMLLRKGNVTRDRQRIPIVVNFLDLIHGTASSVIRVSWPLMVTVCQSIPFARK